MQSHLISLDSIRVASLCPMDWSTMQGDERVRLCPGCQQNVYNFKELTRDEVALLIESNENRLCARLYRRHDGTLLTKDCPYEDSQPYEPEDGAFMGDVLHPFPLSTPTETSKKSKKSTQK